MFAIEKLKIIFWTGIIVVFTGAFNVDILGQDLVINEIQSSNSYTIEDNFGEYSDWIEIYNRGNQTINLGEYSLSDESASFNKWKFPDLNIPPKAFQVVYASGRDTSLLPLFWNSIIDWGSEWKYMIPNQAPDNSWNQRYYNDSNWEQGKSGIGYGDGDDSTIIEACLSFYCRKDFYVENPQEIKKILFSIDADDGFVAYLNGMEIARNNVSGLPPSFDTKANVTIEPSIIKGSKPESYLLDERFLELLKYGKNVLAVQVHNASITSSDLTFIPFLSLASESIPANQHVAGILELDESPAYLHTNFRISNGEEWVFLSDSSGNLLDYCDTVALSQDHSYGRRSDGNVVWMDFQEPTPGKSNNLSDHLDFSHRHGFHTNSFYLKIESIRGYEIRYTTDGSIPNSESELFQDSLLIDFWYKTPNKYSLIPTSMEERFNVIKAWEPPLDTVVKATVVRARSFSNGKAGSKVYTNTYWVDSLGTNRYSLPVFSITTDSLSLFDYDSGIFVPGVHADTNWNRTGNFFERGREWEKPVSIEYFTDKGQEALHQDGGMRIHGQYSRRAAQKSLRLYAREEYGRKYFNYPLLPESKLVKYKRVILRTSMMTFSSRFGDAFIHDLSRNLNFEFQDFQPVIVFINGEYWGVHNMREYLDDHYLGSHYPEINKDSVDLLRQRSEIMEGSSFGWNQLYHYIEQNDLSDSTNYAYICSQIDIDNFLDYTITEMYMGNRDWPGNNYIYWRPQDKSKKWRWILNDLDAAFSQYKLNMIEQALAPDLNRWPNPSWSTLIFRKLFENENFKTEFICRSKEYMNTVFHPDTIISAIQHYKEFFNPEMQEHIIRWNYPASDTIWRNFYDTIVPNFARQRPEIFMQHIQDQFNLTETQIEEMCPNQPEDTLVIIDTTAIKSHTQIIDNILVYPNPNTGKFTINLKDSQSQIQEIKIFDLRGREIYRKVNPELITELSLTGEASGVYILSFRSGNHIQYKKVIIQ